MEVIRAVLRDPPPEVSGYLSRPPQTNEVGRAAALASGMACIAREAGLPLRLRELGASAGLNLRLDAYWYEQHGVGWGNTGSPDRRPGWRHRAHRHDSVPVVSLRFYRAHGVGTVEWPPTDASSRTGWTPC